MHIWLSSSLLIGRLRYADHHNQKLWMGLARPVLQDLVPYFVVSSVCPLHPNRAETSFTACFAGNSEVRAIVEDYGCAVASENSSQGGL